MGSAEATSTNNNKRLVLCTKFDDNWHKLLFSENLLSSRLVDLDKVGENNDKQIKNLTIMKKLLLLAVVALPLLFTSCTKPEDELFGTWRNVEENVTLDLSETKFGKRFFIDYGKSFGGSWDYLQSTNEVYCIPDVENPDFSSLSFIKVGDRLFWKGEDLYLDKI